MKYLLFNLSAVFVSVAFHFEILVFHLSLLKTADFPPAFLNDPVYLALLVFFLCKWGYFPRIWSLLSSLVCHL